MWPYLVLLGEILLFFRLVLFRPQEYVIPWDFQYFAFNLASFILDSFRAGEFPLWDPYTYCGMPFFANPQTQLFYPPALIAILLGGGHLMTAITVELALHAFAAGVFTYWLLRELGCSRLAALLGATAFELGCFFASQTQHFGAITGTAWLPLSLLAVVRLGRAGTARWVAVLAVSLALPILAGFPSTAGVAFLCTGIFALSFWRVRLLLQFAAGVVGALALAAVQLVPAIQAAAGSVSAYREDWRGPGSGLRLEALTSLVWPNAHHVLDLKGYTLPYNFTFLYLFCGLVTLALAATAIRQLRLVTLLVVCFVLMMGDSTWVGRVILPYFLDATHDAVYPEFFMGGFSLAIAALAGLGANRFRSRPRMLGALLVLSTIELVWAGSGRPMNTRALKDEPGVTAAQFDGSAELLQTVRSYLEKTKPPSRLDTFGDSMSWVSMAPTTHIYTAGGNEAFAQSRYMDVRRKFTGGERWGRYYEIADLNSPVLDSLNVRYVISRQPVQPLPPKYRLAATLPGRHYLYENTAALPRFHMADRTEAIEPVHYSPNRVVIETRTGGKLISSEVNYPGWRAFIDGQPAPIREVNGPFRAVDVPAGRHRVEFRFVPVILFWSAAVSFLTLLALMIAALQSKICVFSSRWFSAFRVPLHR